LFTHLAHLTTPPTARNIRLLGSTLLRDRLLRAEGYAVVSVPFYEWEGVPNGDAQRGRYLQRKVDEAAGGGGGG